MDTCSVEGCDAPIKVKKFGLCQRHYHRFWAKGTTDEARKNARGACSVEGCERAHAASGLCDMHYRRQKRYGTTDRPARPVTCTAEGCDRGVNARGLCDKHYRRVIAGGEVEPERACRYCGSSITGLNMQRRFCDFECLQRWQYWERRRTYRTTWLKRYGLTVEQYDVLVEAQGNRCAICRGTESKNHSGHNHWDVDHDHVTGTVRGLLCSQCNIGIGKFRDDPDLLLAAVDYLKG